MEGNDAVAVQENRFRDKESGSAGSAVTRRSIRARVALEALAVGNAVAFLAASVVHLGYTIPLGFATLSDRTILPAGIAEGVIGVGFAIAAAFVFAKASWAWNGTIAAYLLGIVGVLIGLGVSLTDSGDSTRVNFLFHLSVLPVLVLGFALTLTRSGRRGLGKPRVVREMVP